MRMLAQVYATKKFFESSTYMYHGPTPKPSPSPPGSRFVLPPQPVVVVTHPRGVRGLPRLAGTTIGYIGLSWGRTGISPLTSLADIDRLEFPQPVGRHSPVNFVQFVL